jgi:hypothetical protein
VRPLFDPASKGMYNRVTSGILTVATLDFHLVGGHRINKKGCLPLVKI